MAKPGVLQIIRHSVLDSTAKATTLQLFHMQANAAVQSQIRAQREFVGWNCLLDPSSFAMADPKNSAGVF
jgi:hypothetical protein